MAKYYVTTPIYYSNAKPHIGSAYTTIAADVIARWHKQQGDDTYLLTGVAEHGAKMAEAAAAHNQSPQEFVDAQAKLFQEAWDKLNIQADDFIRTTEKRHEEAVVAFFNKLKDSGKIYQGEYTGLYCVGHEAFIKESELDANGNCPDHGKKPKIVKEQNWFFKLSEYAPILLEKIESGELNIQPSSRRAEVISFIQQGLEDISISRQAVEWAIPLPWDPEQTIYVWLDELFNYCSAIGYLDDPAKFKKYWPANVHLVGKDIIKFHCIIWPALLMAIGEEIPKQVFAHGFFTVNGQKMSKTLGNVIDPVELADEYGADIVRYFVLREIPFGHDGDVSTQRLVERYNSDLANGLGNLVSRSLNMIEKYWPEYDGTGSLPNELQAEVDTFQQTMENLALDKALFATWKLVAWADSYIETNRPWEIVKAGDDAKLKEILINLYVVLKEINQQLAPFLPETHEKLTQLLDARPLKKPEQPLFARK